MKSPRLTGILCGATALALVTASAATAQQSTGQDATQQQTTQQGAEQSGQQAQGGQQQGEQADAAQAGGGEAQQATMQIQQHLQQAADALEQDDMEGARQALEQADQQLQGAMQQDGGEQQNAMSELQQQIQEVTDAIEQQDAESAGAALDEARTQLQEIRTSSTAQPGEQQAGQQADQQQADQADMQQGGGQQSQGTEQAMDDLRQHLQQVREAVAQQDFEQAEQSLQDLETALDEMQMTSSGGGDISVTVVPADEQASATADAERERLTAEETNRLLGLGDREVGDAAEVLTLTPLDLRDRDVITMDGDEVGEVEEVVSAGGQFYAVISHGGFLGIGEDNVAIPLERLGMRGEEVILLGLTEEQLEAMPEYDYESDEAIADEQAIEIGRYE